MKNFKNYLLEMAIPLSTYRDVVKSVRLSKRPTDIYFKIFSNYDTGPRKGKKPYRIYFPLKVKYAPFDYSLYKKAEKINTFITRAFIKKYINEKYEVEDYIAGIVTNKNGKRIIKIGKLLNQIIKKARKNNDHNYVKELLEIKNDFEQDKTRKKYKNIEYYVVISHHPYDVAGMSTNRGWTSCMNLYGGSYSEYVMSDIEEGSIIAYLVKNKDFNIEKPINRILIKPFINIKKSNDFILIPDKPTTSDGPENEFFKFVDKWCWEVNKKYLNYKEKTLYCFNPKLYDNNNPHYANIINLSFKQLIKKPSILDGLPESSIIRLFENVFETGHSSGEIQDLFVFLEKYPNYLEYLGKLEIDVLEYLNPDEYVFTKNIDKIIDFIDFHLNNYGTLSIRNALINMIKLTPENFEKLVAYHDWTDFNFDIVGLMYYYEGKNPRDAFLQKEDYYIVNLFEEMLAYDDWTYKPEDVIIGYFEIFFEPRRNDLDYILENVEEKLLNLDMSDHDYSIIVNFIIDNWDKYKTDEIREILHNFIKKVMFEKKKYEKDPRKFYKHVKNIKKYKQQFFIDDFVNKLLEYGYITEEDLEKLNVPYQMRLPLTFKEHIEKW